MVDSNSGKQPVIVPRTVFPLYIPTPIASSYEVSRTCYRIAAMIYRWSHEPCMNPLYPVS